MRDAVAFVVRNLGNGDRFGAQREAFTDYLDELTDLQAGAGSDPMDPEDYDAHFDVAILGCDAIFDEWRDGIETTLNHRQIADDTASEFLRRISA